MRTDTLDHEPFCLPRPGETEPRTESYRADQYDEHGRLIARPLVERCVECGTHRVTGALPSVSRARSLDEG